MNDRLIQIMSETLAKIGMVEGIDFESCWSKNLTKEEKDQIRKAIDRLYKTETI